MINFTHTTTEACIALHVSDSTLRRLRRMGVLQAGVHFRAVGAGISKPALLWDVKATDEALANRSQLIGMN